MSESRWKKIGSNASTLVALGGLALLVACDARPPVDATSDATTDGGNALPDRVAGALAEGEPLVVVDGVIQGRAADLEELNALDIARIEVVKGAAAEGLYGARAADGVVQITTEGADADGDSERSSATVGPGGSGSGAVKIRGITDLAEGDGRPLVIVDGVVQSDETPLSELKAVDIERVEVVKGPAARELYGERAADGVIQITTKAAGSGAG